RRANNSLVMRPDVFPHLVMPIGPFVSAFRAPVVQVMSDAAVPENLRHPVRGPAVFPRATAGHEVDVATGVLKEIPWVTLVSHIGVVLRLHPAPVKRVRSPVLK